MSLRTTVLACALATVAASASTLIFLERRAMDRFAPHARGLGPGGPGRCLRQLFGWRVIGVLLLLAACQPAPGEIGHVACETLACDGLYSCSEVIGNRGETESWVESPDAEPIDCAGSDCTRAIEAAACAMDCSACAGGGA